MYWVHRQTMTYSVNENVEPDCNWCWLCVSCKILLHFISHFICCQVCSFAFCTPPPKSNKMFGKVIDCSINRFLRRVHICCYSSSGVMAMQQLARTASCSSISSIDLCLWLHVLLGWVRAPSSGYHTKCYQSGASSVVLCLLPRTRPYRARCGHREGCILTTWPK